MVAAPDREPDVFAAISHPSRHRILDLLVQADRSVNAIAGYFQMSRSAVSQQSPYLLDAGLVTEQRPLELFFAVIRRWETHLRRWFFGGMRDRRVRGCRRSQPGGCALDKVAIPSR